MGYEYYELSVTSSNTSQTFTSGKDVIRITNKGDDLVYYNIGAAATTSHIFLFPGESRIIKMQSMASIQAICDSGNTATLEVEGLVG